MSRDTDNAAYRSEVGLVVYIDVRDPSVIERVTGPGGDDWRSAFYKLHTAEDVLNHLAYNAVMNRVTNVSRLDGWGDCEAEAVVFTIDGFESRSEPWD